jgi:hypothetical protein
MSAVFPGCAMLGGGGIGEHEASAVSGGGGTDEQEGSAVTGGGGIAEQDGSAISGGGGTAEQDGSAISGGGGIAEHDGNAVLGGGGMTDPDSEVRGGGGMAEQASAVLGGGGIIDPERAWLSAFARTSCPASTIARPSSSPVSDRVPDSIHSILQRIRPSVNPVLARNPVLAVPLRQAPGDGDPARRQQELSRSLAVTGTQPRGKTGGRGPAPGSSADGWCAGTG